MVEWINVKDGLPKEGESVIFLSQNKKTRDVLYKLAYIYKGNGRWCGSNGVFIDLTTRCEYYWMPLPEPPKGVEE